MIMFEQEQLFDAVQIEALLTSSFGPDRFAKASYRLREGVAALLPLCWVARDRDNILGTVRFWPVIIEDMLCRSQQTALFLGPLAVAPELQGKGLGNKLMKHALKHVDKLGYDRVLLVGDHNYYKRFAFERALPRYITLPGACDADRLLVRQHGAAKSLPSVGKLVPAKCVDVKAPMPALGTYMPA